eukprot:5762779-Amphidinium_carterae.4
MDDLSSNHTRARAESDTQRPDSEGGSDRTKMAGAASHQHASSAAAAAATSTAAAPADRSDDRPWLRLTASERQNALRELERLPQCLRIPTETPPDPAGIEESHEVRSLDNLLTDLGMSFVSQRSDPDAGLTKERAKALGEVRLADLTEQQRKSFEGADMMEWEGIKKVVIVHEGQAAKALRERWPERIISGRMVRRLKSQPGVGAEPKPK